ncbi:hypothetical protein CMU84_16450 [Elizabethkingia anophelis]|nr:hypothetical protein [Elizabethkingia anophelis]MDV3734237.1 hypothetical protein [Elizabethkingia anophelis]
METPKEKAIKAAYGEYWDKVKDYVDEDGWCNAFFGIAARDFDDTESKREAWRPKSLSGIETNNSWTRIESEEDLPKDRNIEDLLIFTETGEILVASSKYLSDAEIRRYWIKTVSHWQKFVKPKPPIF